MQPLNEGTLGEVRTRTTTGQAIQSPVPLRSPCAALLKLNGLRSVSGLLVDSHSAQVEIASILSRHSFEVLTALSSAASFDDMPSSPTTPTFRTARPPRGSNPMIHDARFAPSHQDAPEHHRVAELELMRVSPTMF